MLLSISPNVSVQKIPTRVQVISKQLILRNLSSHHWTTGTFLCYTDVTMQGQKDVCRLLSLTVKNTVQDM